MFRFKIYDTFTDTTFTVEANGEYEALEIIRKKQDYITTIKLQVVEVEEISAPRGAWICRDCETRFPKPKLTSDGIYKCPFCNSKKVDPLAIE